MKKIITTHKAPQPIGPYNQAVLVGDMLYTSGQIAIHPETGDLAVSYTHLTLPTTPYV